jgi:hypothetical protein
MRLRNFSRGQVTLSFLHAFTYGMGEGSSVGYAVGSSVVPVGYAVLLKREKNSVSIYMDKSQLLASCKSVLTGLL